MKKSNRMMRICVALALAGGATGAWAAGFALIEQNASGLGNAYSGQAAAAENASTIYFNPAGMTRLPGMQFSATVSGVNPSAKFSNNGLSAAPAPAAFHPLGDNGGDAGGWSGLPAGYFSAQAGQKLWVGVGVTVPFGLKTDYGASWMGRFQSQHSEVKTYDINPSIAYKVNDWLSIGGGVSYQHGQLQLKRSVDFGLSEGLMSLDVSDHAWGGNLGVMLNPKPGTQIGFAYRSSISYTLTGVLAVSGAANAAPNASLNIRLPDSFSAGLSQVLNDRWNLLADATYTRWSTVKAVPLVSTSAAPTIGAPAGTVLDTFNLQFRDGYRIGIGANYKWTDEFMLKLGAAYDRSPVTDQFRTPFLPDSDRTWLAIGGKYSMSKVDTIDFGYAHLFMPNASINQLKGVGLPAAGVFPTPQGNLVGTYSNHVDIISIQYTHSF